MLSDHHYLPQCDSVSQLASLFEVFSELLKVGDLPNDWFILWISLMCSFFIFKRSYYSMSLITLRKKQLIDHDHLKKNQTIGILILDYRKTVLCYPGLNLLIKDGTIFKFNKVSFWVCFVQKKWFLFLWGGQSGTVQFLLFKQTMYFNVPLLPLYPLHFKGTFSFRSDFSQKREKDFSEEMRQNIQLNTIKVE